MWEKISDEQALALKPKILPFVEPELQAKTPRPMVWVYPKSGHREITKPVKNLLTEGSAVRAWITRHITNSDRESDEHFVQYCFESDEKIIQGKNYRSYDDFHLAFESPDYSLWMDTALYNHKSFTILYKRDEPAVHEIYGHLELYIEADLFHLSNIMKNSINIKELIDLSNQFLKIALGPLKKHGVVRDKYLHLMRELGLANNKDINDSNKNIQIIKNIIPKNQYSQQALIELSAICKEFIPGIWAAK